MAKKVNPILTVRSGSSFRQVDFVSIGTPFMQYTKSAFTAPSKSQKLFLDFRPAAIAPIYLGIDHVDALHIYSPTRRDDNENCGVPSVFI